MKRVLCLLLMLPCVGAYAEESNQDFADPHNGASTWLAPNPQQQMRGDTTVPGVLQGAIFVPRMTEVGTESYYEVRDADDKLVKREFPGSSVYVSPGQYTVVVGSPSLEKKLEFETTVDTNEVTYVPVEWSGLTVKVVNERGVSFRGNYEIVRLPDYEYVGYGSGASLVDGDEINTWTLWPGLYMIISAGEDYHARKNFITVQLLPGVLSQVTIVLNPENGDMYGGGLVHSQQNYLETSAVTPHFTTGGSLAFNSTRNVLGKNNGNVLDISAFVEFSLTALFDKHYFYTRLNGEVGGAIRFNDGPFLQSVNELSLEALYSYRVFRWFGPYARLYGESTIVPNHQELADLLPVEIRNAKGNVIETQDPRLDVKLAPPFSPVRINLGTGAKFDLRYTMLDFSARAGVGYRHFIARDLFRIEKTEADKIILREVESNYNVGAELSLFAEFTPIRWFSLRGDFFLLEPFDKPKYPIIDLKLTSTLRFSTYASIAYTFTLNYDRLVFDKVQSEHMLRLRFSYTIL